MTELLYRARHSRVVYRVDAQARSPNGPVRLVPVGGGLPIETTGDRLGVDFERVDASADTTAPYEIPSPANLAQLRAAQDRAAVEALESEVVAALREHYRPGELVRVDVAYPAPVIAEVIARLRAAGWEARVDPGHPMEPSVLSIRAAVPR